ncbi:MAG: hypothetical protein J5786_03185 [Clostridiales bacterium]|nr:hypothetical protein [Clostridiales bacterium]
MDGLLDTLQTLYAYSFLLAVLCSPLFLISFIVILIVRKKKGLTGRGIKVATVVTAVLTLIGIFCTVSLIYGIQHM